MIGHLLYLAVMFSLAMTLPDYYFDADSAKFIFILGAVAIWRYTWAANHFIRALIYTRRVFPKLRQKSDEAGSQADPGHIFLLMTTFRISAETSIEVYRAAIREAMNYEIPTTIVASIVEMSEERLVKGMFYALNPPEHIQLKLVRIKGSGKRDGLAAGFRAVSNSNVTLEDSVVALIDGDTILTKGILGKCFRFFKLNPKLGALTTDEYCTLQGDMKTIGVYRRWYNLRFAQRTVYMGSLALSNKVLTLTGRMSLYRGEIVGDAEFVNRVQYDYVDHWRLGRFRFLTGDDKSTWYHVLKGGWEMLYVPDTHILTVEEPPSGNFFTGATMLMRRWFGNMLRTNTRARKVPRNVSGLFTWWTIIDQRISMWTSLFGLFGAILGSLVVGPVVLVAFAVWIMFTRYIMSLFLTFFHKEFSISWPFLIYFNQIYGSLVKIYIMNHLNKQKWTRQKTTLKETRTLLKRFFSESGSNVAWAGQMLIFITFMSFLVGLINMQDVQAFLDWLRLA